MNRIVVSIAKKVGYIIAALIILVAVLVCVSRLLTPVLDGYKPEIEKRASQLLGVPVKIAAAEISWFQYQPGINLKEVTFLDKETNEPAIQIKKVGVYFSIPQSIWQWKLVPSGLVLVGSEVNVMESKTGEYVVQGLPSLGDQPLESETKFADIINALSAQPRLVLHDVDVHYTGFKGDKRFITLYNLSFKNNGIQHTVLGKAILHQELATDVTVAIDWEGAVYDLTKIKAKIYLYVSGFSFSQWLKNYVYGGWHIKKGVGSAKIWATWENNALARVQTNFELYDVALYSETDKSTHSINRFSGDIGWKHNGDQQTIAGDNLLIDLSSHLWPMTSFYYAFTQDANGNVLPKAANIGYVNLNDIQPYLFAFPDILTADNKKTLTNMKVKGVLQNAAVVFGKDWKDIHQDSISASFSQFGFSPWKNMPGIAQLSGKASWDGKQGTLSLQSNQVQFQDDAIFLNKLKMDQLMGEVKLQPMADNAWELSTGGLQLTNPDLTATIAGSLIINANGTPVADLKGNFSLQKANHASRYLPMKIFSADLVEWLQEAFLAGNIQSGSAILKGKLSDFPFDNNNGTFLISGIANNIDLRFAPEWPMLQKIKGKLIFSGRQMTVDVTHAETLGIPIGEVHASIPYFGDDKPSILYVDGKEIEAEFGQGLDYVHASPLESSIGHMFTGTEAEGPIALTLNLTVPLNDTDKTQVKGDLKLKNNEVRLVPWKLNLDKVNGEVHFTENTTSADQLNALLFNKPVKIKLGTVQKSKTVSVARASFENNLAISDLEKWLKMPFSKTVKGQTEVKGYIDFSPTTPIEIHLQSNLTGLSINLPDEYSKKQKESRDFTADISVQEKQPLRIKASYGKLLSTALILQRAQDTFKLTSINLRLGGGDPEWPKSAGLYISGTIPQLNWEKIKQYAGQTGTKQNQGFSGYSLKEVDITIGKLTLPGGQSLDQINVQLTPNKDYWDVDVSNADINGEISVPTDFSPARTLTAQFDKLRLRSSKGNSSSTSTVDVKSLPSISLLANNVSFNDIPLGRITLKTVPNGKGATIQSLRISAPNMELQSSGTWTQSSTRIQGKLNSSSISGFLNSTGMDASNFVASKGDLDFDLNWRGAFFAPNLVSMNGTVTMKIGPGRVVDLGQSNDAKLGVGRLLSIFSLQTIPKRLTLDFSDLFQKGYNFDSLTGDFNLKNGSAYTTNMTFKGTVARVDINGRIGLSQQDLDFTLSVTPGDVTSGLPVAATFLGGPVGGIAALAVNTVIGSQISKAATHYYAVKGSWANPTWESITSTPKR